MTDKPRHKYYSQAYDAHRGTSFVPEKRAASECEWYDEICAQFESAGKHSAIEKFDQLFLKSLSAKSRCVSTMIAGPANFPTARMQKYRGWEEAATRTMLDFVTKALAPPATPRKEIDYHIEHKEYVLQGVRVLQNTDDNRLQLFFDGKPELSVIAALKRNGFKWSPHNRAWQRQLTPNAVNAVSHVIMAPNNPATSL